MNATLLKVEMGRSRLSETETVEANVPYCVSMVTPSGQNSVNAIKTQAHLLQIYCKCFIESKTFQMQLSNYLIRLSSIYMLF